MLDERDDSELLEWLIDEDELESELLLRLDELSEEDILEDELDSELILEEELLLLALCASTTAAGRNNERADRGKRYLRISPL